MNVNLMKYYFYKFNINMFKTCLYITSLAFSYICIITLISVGILSICLDPQNNANILVGITFIILSFVLLWIVYFLRSYYCPCCYLEKETDKDNIKTQTQQTQQMQQTQQTQQIITDIDPIPTPYNITYEIAFNNMPMNSYEDNEITFSYL